MDRKFLEGLGIEKENIEKIMTQHGMDITGLKTEITTKDATIKKLRDDVIEKDGKIAELEKVDVKELQTQLAAEKEGRETDKKNFVLKSTLISAGCTDPEYVMYKLGKEVEFDERGKIKDSENFIKKTKETFAGQFQGEEPGGTGSAGNFNRSHGGNASTDKNPYTEKGWNLTEQMTLELNDPEKASRLKEEAKMTE